ncbi:hypothetical protein Tco_1021111, partial [Tanacetum coccineum]
VIKQLTAWSGMDLKMAELLSFTLYVLDGTSTPVFVEPESSTQADRAQSSRVPVPLLEDPYETIGQAYLDGTDTKSEPFEDPVDTETLESSLAIAPPIPLSEKVSVLLREFTICVATRPSFAEALSRRRGHSKESDWTWLEERRRRRYLWVSNRAAPFMDNYEVLDQHQSLGEPKNTTFTKWTLVSLPISPSHSDVPSPISSPMIPLTIPSPVSTPAAAKTVGFSLTCLGLKSISRGGTRLTVQLLRKTVPIKFAKVVDGIRKGSEPRGEYPTHLIPILRRTARMVVHIPHAMSLGVSASMAEVAAMSESALCKRFRSSYESLPSMSPPDLPLRKHYRGTSELVEDSKEDDDEEDEEIEEKDEDPVAEDEGLTSGVEGPGMHDEGYGLDDERHGRDDESHGIDDEGHSVKSDGLGLEVEEDVPGGQQ